ncbi:hypothetical protein PROFUN_14688 [Planoprotostelium fungivorum]|uniref:Uncharacterized protein n=1 Tax=Planoprotostelium fungivorum TaxID=1890364 RepID=A0A2P6MZ73_9EUKA|nr:hypothetical protein PROFUN_14688 [Planoprotostelium fungivorum]
MQMLVSAILRSAASCFLFIGEYSSKDMSSGLALIDMLNWGKEPTPTGPLAFISLDVVYFHRNACLSS